MIVADVMTRNVISIGPDATVEDAARLMLDRGISGILVVDQATNLVGVITEGDLLRRDELGTQAERSWWDRLLTSPATQAQDFSRAYGRHVRDVMVSQVISIAHDAPLENVVQLMEKNHIKRVPVTQDGRVVGVVSRSDLLRALLGQVRAPAATPMDDAAIHAGIMAGLEKQPWAPATTLNVQVNEGVVDLHGAINSEEERQGIRVIAENVPGVKAVNDRMVFVEPYTGTVIDPPEGAP